MPWIFRLFYVQVVTPFQSTFVHTLSFITFLIFPSFLFVRLYHPYPLVSLGLRIKMGLGAWTRSEIDCDENIPRFYDWRVVRKESLWLTWNLSSPIVCLQQNRVRRIGLLRNMDLFLGNETFQLSKRVHFWVIFYYYIPSHSINYLTFFVFLNTTPDYSPSIPIR